MFYYEGSVFQQMKADIPYNIYNYNIIYIVYSDNYVMYSSSEETEQKHTYEKICSEENCADYLNSYQELLVDINKKISGRKLRKVTSTVDYTTGNKKLRIEVK